MNTLYVIGGIVLFFVLAVVTSYNRFVSQRNLIKDSWSNVDTELRRRYDLIPNLVQTVKGYAQHEQAVLQNVTQARAAAASLHGKPAQQAQSENALVSALRQLFAVVENYPQLRASPHFLELQRELANTEDRIQAARRFYNNNVRDYNSRVQSVPSNIIANMFGFTLEEYFEVDAALRAGAPEVGLA